MKDHHRHALVHSDTGNQKSGPREGNSGTVELTPFGPSEVLTVSARALAAIMFERRTSFSFSRRRRVSCWPPPCCWDIFAFIIIDIETDWLTTARPPNRSSPSLALLLFVSGLTDPLQPQTVGWKFKLNPLEGPKIRSARKVYYHNDHHQ